MSEHVLITIGIILAILYRYRDTDTGALRLPSWIWKAISVFGIYMLLRNFQDVYAITSHEADQWWPLFKELIKQRAEDLRLLFKKFLL
jgi:hypothetical protein